MQGKIKFKLIKDPFFNKRAYKIFVNGNFIGEISNRKSEFDLLVSYGQQKLRIVGSKYEKVIDLSVGPSHIIKPVYISHSYVSGTSAKWLRYFLILTAVAILSFEMYNLISYSEFKSSYLFMLVLLIVALIKTNKKEFKVSSKRFSLS